MLLTLFFFFFTEKKFLHLKIIIIILGYLVSWVNPLDLHFSWRSCTQLWECKKFHKYFPLLLCKTVNWQKFVKYLIHSFDLAVKTGFITALNPQIETATEQIRPEIGDKQLIMSECNLPDIQVLPQWRRVCNCVRWCHGKFCFSTCCCAFLSPWTTSVILRK